MHGHLNFKYYDKIYLCRLQVGMYGEQTYTSNHS